MAAHLLTGNWEVIFCIQHGSYRDSTEFEGVRFTLEETGDVTWTVSDDIKSIPLFSCETYELYNTSLLGITLRFGAYAGHVIEFKCEYSDPADVIVLTCEGWCTMHCKRTGDLAAEQSCDAGLSFALALEEGFFSDVTIAAANNKQFKAHSCILQLLGSDLNWNSAPPPFSGLPEEVLSAILHFLYAECLPTGLTEATARQVIAAVSPYQSMAKLVGICQAYLKNMALKQQIISLVSDMHLCASQIIEHFSSNRCNLAANPAKLCFVVKQSFREASVAGVKLLLLCDLFTKRKNELSREERHEVIRYAKSRFPVFMTQLFAFLTHLKTTFSNMTPSQRQEVATYLVPEIETVFETTSALFVEIKAALEHMIQVLSPSDNRGKGVGGILGKSLRNVLHIRELTKLKNVHDHITCSLGLLVHRKEAFNDMNVAQKTRSIVRNMEQLIEELPVFLLRLDEFTAALDEKLEWREFKFCFKVGTSKVSGILQKLLSHRDALQEVMTQACELVQRDAFTQSLVSLGLLHAAVASNTTSSLPAEDHHRHKVHLHMHHHQPANNLTTTGKLNLVESLCSPPSLANSCLSKAALQLFKSSAASDMVFEVVAAVAPTTANPNNETTTTSSSSCEATISDNSDNNVVVMAHRAILASRCDWFRRALLSGMRESIDKKIMIHDANPAIFKHFLEYLYCGRIFKSQLLGVEQLSELLLLSDRYDMDTLKEHCQLRLRASIEEESVLYFLSIADQFNAMTLKEACLEFVSRQPSVMGRDEFGELPSELQTEIYDTMYWARASPRTSLATERLLPQSELTPSPASSIGELRNLASNLQLYHHHQHSQQQQQNPVETYSSSSSLNDEEEDDVSVVQESARLDHCLAELRAVLGSDVSRDRLVRVALAADYDVNRALNFYFCQP